MSIQRLRLSRHLDGLTELEAPLDAARIEDFTVDNEAPPATVAAQILARTGWLPAEST